jgi:hypothetical protein
LLALRVVQASALEERAATLITLRRLKNLRCKIFHKHARIQVVSMPPRAPRALFQIFITNTFNHRLWGFVARC